MSRYRLHKELRFEVDGVKLMLSRCENDSILVEEVDNQRPGYGIAGELILRDGKWDYTDESWEQQMSACGYPMLAVDIRAFLNGNSPPLELLD